MMDPTMNLISRTHHLCEKREYAFMVLREYTIIFRSNLIDHNENINFVLCNPNKRRIEIL